jgi:hypothetical protein
MAGVRTNKAMLETQEETDRFFVNVRITAKHSGELAYVLSLDDESGFDCNIHGDNGSECFNNKTDGNGYD